MYFQQFYLACLSHASYMLGSKVGSEGVACVVDPQRDVGAFLRLAHELVVGVANLVGAFVGFLCDPSIAFRLIELPFWRYPAAVSAPNDAGFCRQEREELRHRGMEGLS